MRVSAVFTHSAQPRLAHKNKSSTETSAADGEEMTGNSLTDCHAEESSDQQTEISSAAQIRTGGGWGGNSSGAYNSLQKKWRKSEVIKKICISPPNLFISFAAPPVLFMEELSVQAVRL